MKGLYVEFFPPTEEDPKREALVAKSLRQFFGDGYQHLFECLGVRRKRVAKFQTIFSEEDDANRFGFILSGSVNIVRYSEDGREKLLMHLCAGEAFGTTFALANAPHYFANAEAAEVGEVLIFNGDKVLNPCAKNCPAHTQLLVRLLKTLAWRNSMLARKIDCLTEHKMSEKIMAYLRMQADLCGETTFRIPFTRQQLADYLNVDRAALSTAIGKLVKAGEIKTTGKSFTLVGKR